MRSLKEAARIGALALLATATWAHAGEVKRHLGTPRAAALPNVPTIVSPSFTARPELRSHQPYSGLQHGFRPEPPGERGIRRKKDARPEVVMPVPVAPLVEYGKPGGTSLYYKYCPANAPCR